MDVLQDFFSWLLGIIFDYVFIPLLGPVIDALPSLSMSSYFNNILAYCGFLYDWIPFGYGFACFGLYLSFIGIMISVKLIVKLFIPTVG